MNVDNKGFLSREIVRESCEVVAIRLFLCTKMLNFVVFNPKIADKSQKTVLNMLMTLKGARKSTTKSLKKEQIKWKKKC